jgi:site-specific DNA-adenine methylase
MNAEKPGKLLGKCKWIGVPFAGGMCEVPYLQAPTVVVNDADAAIINLARCVAKDAAGLAAMLADSPFHPRLLTDAQAYLRQIACLKINEGPRMEWAWAYFISCWMARNDAAGTDRELDAQLSVRWNGNGGDSNKRFRSAVESLAEWSAVMRSCSFTCMDAFEFLDPKNCKDVAGNDCGLYVDAPWPDDGDAYKHKFSESDQRRLADRLREFKSTRIVVRFGDHPLIREIYPDSFWRWRFLESRTQANKVKQEALLTNF